MGGPLVRDAFELAARVHAGQTRRADGADFIAHLVRVAHLVRDAGGDEETVAAALLHDSVEKAGVAASEIRALFGPRVCEMVTALTDDCELADYALRKRALCAQVKSAGHDAAMIHAADKLINLRDTRAVWEVNPEVITERIGIPIAERVELWGEDLAMVRDQLQGLDLLIALEAELSGFKVALNEPVDIP